MNRRVAAAVLAFAFLMSPMLALAAGASTNDGVSADSSPVIQNPSSSAIVDIAYPRMMRPAFVGYKGELDIVLSTSGSLSPWLNVTLMPGGYACDVGTVVYEGSNATVSISIPAMPEGNYDLLVEEGGESFTQTRAVSVTYSFDGDYHFVHLTDLHIGGEGTAEMFPELREKIALLNPDFVVIGGDIIDANMGGDSYSETMLMLELFSDFPCPTFATPGNHEYGYIFSSGGGIQDYRDYVNPVLDYSFQYGEDTFVMLNTGKYATILNYMGMEVPHPNNNVTGITDAQIDWLIDTFEDAPDGNRFIVTHAPLVNTDDNQEQTPDNNRREAVEVAEHFGVDAIFSGHVHEDKLFDADGVRQFGTWKDPAKPWHVQTRSALTADASGTRGFDPDEQGFRDVRVSRQGITLTEDRDDDGYLDADSSILMSELSVEGDGTDSVTVHNGLGRMLSGGRIVINSTESFDAPESVGGDISGLTVGDGWIEAEILVYIAPGETVEVALVDNPVAPRIASVKRVDDSVVVRFDKAVIIDMEGPYWECFTILPDGWTTPELTIPTRLNWSTWSFKAIWLFNPLWHMPSGPAEFRYSGSGVADYQGRPLDSEPLVAVLDFPDMTAPYGEAFDAPEPFNPFTDEIEITFSKDMDRASTESAIRLEPFHPHTIEWTDARHATLRLTGVMRTGDLTQNGIWVIIDGAVDANGVAMRWNARIIYLADDFSPPLLLSAETLGNGSARFIFSEPVRGVAEALSPACTVIALSASEYIAGPMISVPTITLDPTMVTDDAGNGLDTDRDGLPGGPATVVPVRIPATTGEIEGACPGDDVTFSKGQMFRRVPSVGGRYRATDLPPGVWTVSSGNASKTVVVSAGVTTVANLAEGAGAPMYGSVTVTCPAGTVRIGSTAKHLDKAGSVTFANLAPGEYEVVYDSGDASRTASVLVEAGGSGDCSFAEPDEPASFPLEYAVAWAVLLALASLACSFLLFKGGERGE